MIQERNIFLKKISVPPTQPNWLLLTHAFEVWNLERVEFRADINNAASINAMKNIGCIEEGVLRNHANIENGRRTSIILSILKDEWFGGVKENLVKKIY